MLDFSKLRRTSRTSHIFIGFIAFSSDLLVTKICLLASVYSVYTHTLFCTACSMSTSSLSKKIYNHFTLD